MKKWRFYLYVLPIAGCIGLAAFLSWIAIQALLNGGKVLVDFNYYGENLIEAIIFPLLVIFGLYGLRKLGRKARWNK